MSTYPCCQHCALDITHQASERDQHTGACMWCENDIADALVVELKHALKVTGDALEAVTAERDALAASVARVRALHNVRGRESWFMPRCSECHGFYPCPTIRALDA